MSKELVEKLQKISYGILCDIDDYCKKNNINYYLSGGSVLGAVRHKGFIPWDDDIDLMFPRKDYEKFIKGFGKAFPDRYQVGSIYEGSEWHRQYARVWDKKTELHSNYINEQTMGVFVDIFPIDGLPDKPWKRRLFYAELKFLNVMRNSAQRQKFWDYEKGILIKKVMHYLAAPLGANWFAKKMNDVAIRYDFDTQEYSAVSLAGHYGSKETIKHRDMAKAVYLDFEGRKFPVPVGYKRYLRNLYGDYMQIPKDAEEKGYSHLDGWTVIIKDE